MKHFVRVFLTALLVLSPSLATAQDKAEDILNKAIEALGGKENLKKYPAERYKQSGKLDVMGMEVEFKSTTTILFPDKEKTEMSLKIGGNEIEMVQQMNGDKARMSIMGMVLPLSDKLKSEILQSTKMQQIFRLYPLFDKEFEIKLLDKNAKVKRKDKETDAVSISVKAKGMNECRLFFDKKTHLLIKLERRGLDSTEQECDQEIYMSDYKEFNGIKRPQVFEIVQDGKDYMTAKFVEFEDLKEVDKKMFDIDD